MNKSTPLGTKFGRLTLIEHSGVGDGIHTYICECGSRYKLYYSNVRSGTARPCKICTPAKSKFGAQKHDGYAAHPLVDTYRLMVQRCTNPKHIAYNRYGGRGITVYESWLAKEDGRALFLAWVDEHLGQRPLGMTLDRIRNKEGYMPGNLRWATIEEQQRNRG